jgi:predicted ester cyclase
MSKENEALVRRYAEEVYDQRKLEVVDEIFASEFTLHDPDLPGGARGPEGIKRIVETFVDAFPDLQITLDDELSSGDKVVTRWTSRGTHQGELMGIAPTATGWRSLRSASGGWPRVRSPKRGWSLTPLE